MQVFNVKVFREYSSDVFNIEAQKVIDYLDMAASSGAVVDFQQIMQAFTLDSFGNVLFGESFGCLDNMDHKVSFADSISDLLGISSDRLVDPMWKIREAITGVGTRNRVKANQLRQHIGQVIVKHRSEEVEEGKSCGQKKRNILMLLMESKNEHGELVDDEYIVDIILNLTIAARDPTAEALAWMLHSLLREETDSEIMKTLVREVDEVLGNELPTYETHKKQKYAEACSPHFPSPPPQHAPLHQDDTLPDGTKIYAGEIFTWSSYVMGRSEKIWGPDVADFKPSRWLASAGEKQASLNKAMSFHVGPRACFGQWFVVMQSLTIMGDRIIDLVTDQGKSMALVARYFNIPASTVRGIVNAYFQTGHVAKLPRGGNCSSRIEQSHLDWLIENMDEFAGRTVKWLTDSLNVAILIESNNSIRMDSSGFEWTTWD
ncbi:hypothetical protein MVEG_01417 [Podila verticillata NRRL 6337]|nr:hypothetical protein MVEG_01417 [Podila verticillata NRRL 6337]